MKDNSCRLVFWMLLGLAIEIAIISWLFHNAIESEKRFIREYEEVDKLCTERDIIKDRIENKIITIYRLKEIDREKSNEKNNKD